MRKQSQKEGKQEKEANNEREAIMNIRDGAQTPRRLSPCRSTSCFSTPSRPPTPPSSPHRQMEYDARQQRDEVQPYSPPMIAPPTPSHAHFQHPQVAFHSPKFLLELAEGGDHIGLLEVLSISREAALQLTERGDSALHVAASRGHVKAVLVLAGVIDVNTTGFRLRTPLHHAAFNGHLGVAICLADLRANINLKDACGLTPLAMACKNRYANLVQYFLTRKAKIDEKALAKAAESGRWDVVDIFLHRTKGLANVCSDDGHPVLVLAAKAKRWDTVKLLLKKGASASKAKSPKECALAYAMKYSQREIIGLLMRKEVNYNKEQLKYCVSLARVRARAQVQERRGSINNP